MLQLPMEHALQFILRYSRDISVYSSVFPGNNIIEKGDFGLVIKSEEMSLANHQETDYLNFTVRL